ncbi:MAG: dihydrofolate reductase family protein [Anaerolineae bacterium]|nr:dihydrofolate reductase family protein [Anaerolineae bacterium]
MRKVIVSTMATANAVIESPQRWSFEYMTEDLMQYVFDQLFDADALIMGRVTYEGFAEAWPTRAGADDFADRINSLPKYVASRTLQEPLIWNASLLKGDVAGQVAQLKQQPGESILQYGLGELTYTLIQSGLVDELRLLVYPVVISGPNIFAAFDQTTLKLLETKVFASGVVALHYQPASAQ